MKIKDSLNTENIVEYARHWKANKDEKDRKKIVEYIQHVANDFKEDISFNLEKCNKLEGTHKRIGFIAMEMGNTVNLIIDMILNGATQDEFERAIRHYLVVSNAGKYGLDYKQSDKENDIFSLRKKYQEIYKNAKRIEKENEK